MNARVTRLEPGAIITLQGDTWRIAGLDGLVVHLRPLAATSRPATWLVADVIADDTFAVLSTGDGQPAPIPDPDLHADRYILDTLDDDANQQVQRRLEAVLLLQNGCLPDSPPDPELAGLTQRQRLPILGSRYGVVGRTLQMWSRDFKRNGVAGLVDKRVTGGQTGTPLTRIDARWRTAIAHVMADYPQRTNVTDGFLIEQIRAEATSRFGDDLPQVTNRTLYRYLNAATRGRNLSTKSQQSRANAPTPDRWWRPVRPSRPGQVVAIDTQHLDAFALDPITGSWQRVQLLMAVDVYSRSIVGWRFTAFEPTSEEVIALLGHIITPKPADRGWPAEAMWRYTGVPETVLAGLIHASPLQNTDDNHDDTAADLAETRVAGVPVLIPDEVTLDHGKIYMSRAVRDACDMLGITIGLARPYTPTDKAHVERAFHTVNTRFVQHLPGYKGPDIHSRGARKHVEDAAFYTLDEIEARFAAWVAVEYQNTPHSSLRHPSLPRVVMTPNQMIDAATPTVGFIPVPVDTQLRIELLPTVWRQVANEGIQVGNLSYDFPGASILDDYRNRPAPYGSQQAPDGRRRWRIKVDRRDLSCVWFYAHTNPAEPTPGEGRWVRVPLRDLPDAGPFQDRHLAHAKRLAVQAGDDPQDRDTVVRHLRGLLNKLAYPTDALTIAEKRLAAHAHAQHVAAQAQRDLLNPDTETDYYQPGSPDDDAEPTLWDNTGTRRPRPTAPTDTAEPGTVYATDDVDEWDPLADEPDIA